MALQLLDSYDVALQQSSVMHLNEVEHWGDTFSKNACRNNPGYLRLLLGEYSVTRIQIQLTYMML